MLLSWTHRVLSFTVGAFAAACSAGPTNAPETVGSAAGEAVNAPPSSAATAPSGPAPTGAPAPFTIDGWIAASQQFGLNQTDVFAVDKGGTLQVAFVAGGGSWQGPTPIATGLPFHLFSQIAVSQQFGTPSPQTDVFIVDGNGALSVTWAIGGGGWQSKEITAQHLFPPGAGVAASRQIGLDQTDVFVVDNNGRLNVVWAQGAGGWQGPKGIGNNGTFTPGAQVAASQQFGLNQTDVFAVDGPGNLEVAWVIGTNAFSGPVPITSGGHFMSGQPLAVSQRFGAPTPETDVFLVDANDNQLTVTSAVGSGPWQGPVGIGGAFNPDTPVAASQQFGVSPPQTDVFANEIDANPAPGIVGAYETVAWAVQGNPYHAPVIIP